MDVEENIELKVDIDYLKNKMIKFNEKLENKLNKVSEDFKRITTDANQKYENLSQLYISEYSSKDCKFIQYANGYFIRLYEIKKTLAKQANELWGTFKICENILDIKGKV
jgi:hypothetical protein